MHRGGGEAQTERTGPLHGHVQALHCHHGGKRVAVAGGESTGVEKAVPWTMKGGIVPNTPPVGDSYL